MALAALVQSTAANRLAIVGVKPDLVLLLILIGTLVYGLQPGLVWAFLGGLMLDIFSGGPMGSSSLALIAAAIGLGMGLGLHGLVAHYGIDIGAMSGGDYEIAGIVMEGKIYSKLTTWVVAKWTLVVIAMTVASSLYPAYRATRLQPVEAIRHV